MFMNKYTVTQKSVSVFVDDKWFKCSSQPIGQNIAAFAPDGNIRRQGQVTSLEVVSYNIYMCFKLPLTNFERVNLRAQKLVN